MLFVMPDAGGNEPGDVHFPGFDQLGGHST
jgi:hypothetical protein